MRLPADLSNIINIRSAPRSASVVSFELAKGNTLPYLGSVPYWHQVQLPRGEIGYASKAWLTVLVQDNSPVGDEEFSVDLIDVGTRLAILVRGSDFALLYDGGRNDDMAYGVDNRFAY